VSKLVPVGRVGRPHGLDGSFVVEQASADERRFTVGATLFVDGEQAQVVASRRVGRARRAIRLDRPVARGSELAVRPEQLPPPEPDHYYVFQLVGLDVVSRGRVRGRVRDVLPGVANDSLELESGELVPLVEDAIVAIDLAARRIELEPGFLDAV
jgi:16S rRNA processing protein RimM